MIMEWVNVLVQGALVGGLYALMAVGLSLAFGVMRLVNIAHGDLTVMAAFAGFAFTSWWGLDPFVALPLVLIVMALVGYALQRGILNHVLGSDILPPLLITFGLSIVIQNGLLEVFSADPRNLDAGALEIGSLVIGGNLRVGILPLLIMGVAIVVFALVQALFAWTRMGRAMRAASDDPDAVKLMGVNEKRVYALAMALAMAVTALGGFFFSIGTSVGPGDGLVRLIYAFEAVIIGGLGSLWGTLAGAIVLGVAQSIAMKIDPGWGILGGHIAFLLILTFRPQGLFPRTQDA